MAAPRERAVVSGRETRPCAPMSTGARKCGSPKAVRRRDYDVMTQRALGDQGPRHGLVALVDVMPRFAPAERHRHAIGRPTGVYARQQKVTRDRGLTATSRVTATARSRWWSSSSTMMPIFVARQGSATHANVNGIGAYSVVRDRFYTPRPTTSQRAATTARARRAAGRCARDSSIPRRHRASSRSRAVLEKGVAREIAASGAASATRVVLKIDCHNSSSLR